MGRTLEGLGAEIRASLQADPGPKGKQAVCDILSRALRDSAFVAEHVTAEQCRPRKVLYEDPELGFCICGHVYEGADAGKPHDHGSTWAIYGVAAGETEMTDWRIVRPGRGDQPARVEPVRTYLMRPGDARFYDVHDVHSPNRKGPTKLIRIEGGNLDRIQRSKIQAA
jgi:hypothetical protein